MNEASVFACGEREELFQGKLGDWGVNFDLERKRGNLFFRGKEEGGSDFLFGK